MEWSASVKSIVRIKEDPSRSRGALGLCARRTITCNCVSLRAFLSVRFPACVSLRALLSVRSSLQRLHLDRSHVGTDVRREPLADAQNTCTSACIVFYSWLQTSPHAPAGQLAAIKCFTQRKRKDFRDNIHSSWCCDLFHARILLFSIFGSNIIAHIFFFIFYVAALYLYMQFILLCMFVNMFKFQYFPIFFKLFP